MTRFIPVLALAVIALALPATSAASAGACGGEMMQVFRQLAGSWNVFRDGERAGRLRMQPVAGGCAMLEDWQTVEGVQAVALHWSGPADKEMPETIIEEMADDPASKTTTGDDGKAVEMLLHQVYVDSNGWSIRADGRISEGVLVYEGRITEDGQELVLRATLRGLGSDEIVHVGEVSTDEGETWQDSFRLVYRRATD